MFSAVVAAVATSWLILRRSPPLFAAPDHADGLARGSVLREEERSARYAHWFIQMRWLAIVVAAVLVFFAVRVVELLPHESWRPLLVTIAALAGMNVTYGALLRGRMATRHMITLQAYGDLLVLTVLLHYSGGVENALATLMLFHVIIAGIVLPRRQCYLVAAVASALFAVLVWAEWARVIEHYTLRVFPHFGGPTPTHAAHNANYALSGVSVQTAVLFLTAYFATTVTDRLRRDERQLEFFAERILAQSQLLERALDITGTGLCVCDRELKSTWSNRRWDTWFKGQSSGDCEGLTGEDGSVPAKNTLEDGRVRVTEVSIGGPRDGDTSRPGGQRIFQLTTAPLVDLEGAATHVVHVGQEITEQKRIQAGMVHAAKLAAVGEIAGKVAHEVNNPIAIISAKARLLLADPREQVPLRTAEELGKITDLADRVARIAQGLLSYCRPAAGPAAPLDLRIPIRKALAIIEAPAAAAGVRIVEQMPDGPPAAYANAGEMEQVFLNLFLNSLDAMPLGGALSVVMGVEGGSVGVEPRLLVLVEDTGCGVPAEIRDHVFEPFVTTKESGRGTGLGLSICLGLVRSNGGEIDLVSEPGRGTLVRLRLPVHVPLDRVAADG